MADIAENTRPPLVLLHGWGLNQGVWQSLKNDLSQDYLVLTPDLPGFGDNHLYPADYSLTEVVDQLATMLPDNSYVCGWSLGGLLAIALAERYPHKVARLALVAASPCFLATTSWPGMQAAVLQQFATALQKDIAQTIQRFLAIQALGSEHARTDIQQLRQAISAYPTPEPAAVSGALRLLAEQDLRASLAKLSQPLSACFGRLDALVPVAMVSQLQALAPSANITILDKASHAPFISHPAEFKAWLQSWLR